MANKRKRKQPASKQTARRKAAQDTGAQRQRGPTRQERWEAARREKRRRRTLQRTVAVVVVVGVVAAVAAWQINKRRNENRAIAAMTSGGCDFDRKSDLGRVNQHATQVGFSVEPPSGGVHDASAASPGVFKSGEAPPDGQLVHAVEHGDIILWHRGLEEAELASLRELVDARADDIFLIERPALPVKVAATGWHKRLLCDDVDVAALRRFITRYADNGPERQPEEPS